MARLKVFLSDDSLKSVNAEALTDYLEAQRAARKGWKS